MSSTRTVSWVVYKTTVHPHYRLPLELTAVCTKAEWDAMEQTHPGEQTLIREGIASEREAELLARGTSGDSKPHLLPPRS
jgi:hypothetical protein